MHRSGSGGDLNPAVRDKPPLPPTLSPPSTRRQTKSPPPLRAFSPEPSRYTYQRPISPTPESEVAKILSFEIPPKRNSVVNFEPEDSKTFRPISPSPITGLRDEERPMSPTPRPFSPVPGWFDDDSPPPCPTSSPPPLSPPPSRVGSPLGSIPPQSRSSSQPSNITLRISPREKRRPVSAPGVPGSRTISPTGPSRPMSPLLKQSRPKSNLVDGSRFVNYRSFQQPNSSHEEFLREREKPKPLHVLVEPKWQVPEWSVEEVVMWVNKAGFQEYSAAFRDSAVDGDILLMLTDANIRDDIGIRNGILRKRFLRELRNLKKNADYSCSDGGTTANFLAKISPEFRCYTYNLISNDLTYDYMLRLDAVSLEDMLKYAGVDSAIHRHKIIEAVFNEDEDSLADSLYSEPSMDVYISYPRVGGAELASLISMQMQLRGFSVYTEAHDGSTAPESLLQQIRESRFYLLVMTPGVLNQCLRDGENHHCRLHSEIAAALEAECKIVPVTLDFQWPEPSELPEDIRGLTTFNGVRWVHDYQTACIDKLEKFIRQDPFLRAESPFPVSRSGRSSPRSCTPSLLSPHVKQRGLRNRTISIDSAIGSVTLF